VERTDCLYFLLICTTALHSIYIQSFSYLRAIWNKYFSMKIMISWGKMQCFIDRSFTEPWRRRLLVLPKMLVPLYQATWHPLQEFHDRSIYIFCHNDLKSNSSKKNWSKCNVTENNGQKVILIRADRKITGTTVVDEEEWLHLRERKWK
jgi:hypothetical protein